jgi:hypothetical protein
MSGQFPAPAAIKKKAIPVTGLGGLYGCEVLRMQHCLDQCCPTFLCTRAQFTDAYGGAGATILLLLLLLVVVVVVLFLRNI